MMIWLVLIIGGVLNFAMRLSFIYLLGRMRIAEAVRRALRFVAPAVLSAIILPELVAPTGTPDLSPGNYRLIAGAVAMLVAWRTKNAVLTILAGALVVVAFQFVR